MNEEELREEVEGSRLDVQAACTRVSCRYLQHGSTDGAPAWMSQHPVQAIITCLIAPPPDPPPPVDPPPAAASSSSSSSLPSASASAPQLIRVAACMPSGYALLHREVGGSEGREAEAEHESEAESESLRAAGSLLSCSRVHSPLIFFPSLHGLLLAHSAQYAANKEAELTRKLQAVMAAQEEEEEEETAAELRQAEYGMDTLDRR